MGSWKQPPYFPAALVLRLEGDVLPRQADGALIHIEGPRDGVEEGGFTRAVGAHDGDEVPLLQTEGNSAQRLLLVHRSGVEGLGDTRKFQHLSVPPFLISAFRFWKAAHCLRVGAAMASATRMAVSSFIASIILELRAAA